MRGPEREGAGELQSRLLRLGRALGIIGCIGVLGGLIAGDMGFEAASAVVVPSLVLAGIGGVAVISSVPTER